MTSLEKERSNSMFALICYLRYSAMAGTDRLWIVAVHLFLMSASLLITGKYMHYVCIHVCDCGLENGLEQWNGKWNGTFYPWHYPRLGCVAIYVFSYPLVLDQRSCDISADVF